LSNLNDLYNNGTPPSLLEGQFLSEWWPMNKFETYFATATTASGVITYEHVPEWGFDEVPVWGTDPPPAGLPQAEASGTIAELTTLADAINTSDYTDFHGDLGGAWGMVSDQMAPSTVEEGRMTIISIHNEITNEVNAINADIAAITALANTRLADRVAMGLSTELYNHFAAEHAAVLDSLDVYPEEIDNSAVNTMTIDAMDYASWIVNGNNNWSDATAAILGGGVTNPEGRTKIMALNTARDDLSATFDSVITALKTQVVGIGFDSLTDGQRLAVWQEVMGGLEHMKGQQLTGANRDTTGAQIKSIRPDYDVALKACFTTGTFSTNGLETSTVVKVVGNGSTVEVEQGEFFTAPVLSNTPSTHTVKFAGTPYIITWYDSHYTITSGGTDYVTADVVQSSSVDDSSGPAWTNGSWFKVNGVCFIYGTGGGSGGGGTGGGDPYIMPILA
jgi:hypothetical protein